MCIGHKMLAVVLALALCGCSDDWHALNAAGDRAYDRDRFADAVKHWEAALTHAETNQDPNRVADSLNNVALGYEALGRFREAEISYRRSIEVNQGHLGPEHPTLVVTICNLADLYDTVGRYTDTEPLYRQALRILTKRRPQDPQIAEIYRELGWVFERQGRFAEAREAYQAGLLRAADAPAIRANLHVAFASLLSDLGLYEQANASLRVAAQLAHELYGANHIETAWVQAELAELYVNQERYPAALALFEEVVEVETAHYGPKSPTIASRLEMIAEIHRESGRFAEAIELLERARIIYRSSLGVRHPKVALVLNQLGLALQAEGRWEQAEETFLDALGIERRVFGPRHTEVALTLGNLARLLREVGRLVDAEDICMQAIEIHKEVLGPRHPIVARHLFDLGMIQRDNEQMTRAEETFRAALSIEEASFGPDHRAVAGTLLALGELLSDTGRSDQAIQLLERALAIETVALGPDHGALAIYRDALARARQTTEPPAVLIEHEEPVDIATLRSGARKR